MTDYIDIVFDGPPSHESGRFVEVENAAGASINVGEWLQRPDGYWVLRIPQQDEVRAQLGESQRGNTMFIEDLNHQIAAWKESARLTEVERNELLAERDKLREFVAAFDAHGKWVRGEGDEEDGSALIDAVLEKRAALGD